MMEEPSSGSDFQTWARHFLIRCAPDRNRPSELESKRSIVERHLLPELGRLSLREVTAQVEAYKARKRGQGLADKTINNHLSVVRRVLAWAASCGADVDRSGIHGFAAKAARATGLSFEESARLLSAADRDFFPMLLLALRVGLRLGELRALTWNDLDLDAGWVTVRRAMVRRLIAELPPSERRVLPIGESVVRALGSHPRRGLAVFCRPDGSWLTQGACKWPLYRALERAGLPRLGWQALRHSFATHLALRGAPAGAVEALLGVRHASWFVPRDRDLSAMRAAVSLLELKERRAPAYRRLSR